MCPPSPLLSSRWGPALPPSGSCMASHSPQPMPYLPVRVEGKHQVPVSVPVLVPAAVVTVLSSLSLCRLLFSAVQQLPLLSAPFPGTFRGQLCGLQLGLLASPQAPHQPCPAQPERTETAALLTARGSAKYPQQLRGALTPQRQPLH